MQLLKLCLFELKPDVRRRRLARTLRKYEGMTGPQAKAEAKRIEEQKIADEVETIDVREIADSTGEVVCFRD